MINYLSDYMRLGIEVFGESHSECIGINISGLPMGLAFSKKGLDGFMKRRAPGGLFTLGFSEAGGENGSGENAFGRDFSCDGDSENSENSEVSEALKAIANACTTKRREPDEVTFEEGITDFGDEYVVSGEVVRACIYNKDKRSKDYSENLTKLRPGHADLGAFSKYGIEGLRPGGGAFSGRMTAPICIAGYIAKEYLQSLGVRLEARIDEIGGTVFLEDNIDSLNSILERIEGAKEMGDSLGGIARLTVSGFPAGAGGASLMGLEGDLARAFYAIPSVKGVEFGSGFYGSRLTGSQNNDEYFLREGKIVTLQNRQGGIAGGISTGMDIVSRIAFKPVPSIGLPQKTVDVSTMTECELVTKGRHDVCVLPRALPVLEAYAALVLLERMGDF